MTSAGLAAMVGLGAFHGLNPAMGWLFAVAAGLQERSQRALVRSLGYVAAGHAASILAVACLIVALRSVLASQTVAVAGGLAIAGLGLYRALTHRGAGSRREPAATRVTEPRGRLTEPAPRPIEPGGSAAGPGGRATEPGDSDAEPAGDSVGPATVLRRWPGVRLTPWQLAVWSFVMSTVHGAGLMLLPVLVADTTLAGGGHDHGGVTGEGGLLWQGGVAVAAHTLATAAVAGAIALAVYRLVGLAILRREWAGLDHVWTIALIASGVVTVALAAL